MKNIGVKLNNALSRIRLVDRFLILIMAILLMQSAYTLFVHETVSQETNSIDIIVRTSAAAIFGYFLSGNFTKRTSSLSTQNIQDCVMTVPEQEAVKSNSSENTEAAFDEAGHISGRCNKLQIAVISVIGIVCLTFLLVLRNFSQITPQTASTVSQLRDFTSACVGFLVSCGKKE